MSIGPFTGTVTNNIWDGEPRITTPGGNPPYPAGTLGATEFYNPITEKIQWEGQVPTSIQNLSMFEINQLGIDYEIKIDFVFTIKSGTQAYCGNIPTINLVVFQGPILSEANKIFSSNLPTKGKTGGPCIGTTTYCLGNDCPTTEFSLSFTNDTYLTILPGFSIQVNPWNNNGGISYDVGTFTLEVVANISLFVSCQTGPELESDFCLTYCSTDTNQELCYPQYRDFCLKEKGADGNINLFTNKSCDVFFEDYLGNVGPKAEVDNYLLAACSQYKNVDEFNAADSNIQDICACHLDKGIYDRLRDSLIAEFPGFKTVDENERCLFPPCASNATKWPTRDIGRFCRLPACINIASINNDGTIKGGTQINQNNACQNIKNQTGDPGQSPSEETKSWLERHWVWLTLGLGVLVVLIIVILIILASEGNKNKPKKL